jgi:hypothetical protein
MIKGDMNPHEGSTHETSSFEMLVDQNPDIINALSARFGRRWAGAVRFRVGNI